MMQVRFLKHGNPELYIEEEVVNYKRVESVQLLYKWERTKIQADRVEQGPWKRGAVGCR